jgi:thioredoxin reductase (NADPH)
METHKVVIIGSGPAGLTSAIYASRADLKPVVIEGMQPGGLLMWTTEVDNFPGFPKGIMGPELMMNMKAQAERFGTTFKSKVVTKVNLCERPFTVVLNDGEETLKAETLIIANGASPKFLGLEAEMRMMGKGVSTCATCDGFFFKDKHVAIVGGGDTALEEAGHLSKMAKKVTIIHRRNEFRASKAMQNMIFAKENVEILWNTVLTDILGTEKVTGLALENTETKETSELALDGVFIAIGHKPNSDIYAGELERDEEGYIIVQNKTGTSIPGVFVAGDVADKRYRQAISSAGAGCMAALDAEKFLLEESTK